MADTSDVELALALAVQPVLTGDYAGIPLNRGWPSAGDIKAAATSGLALVTVTTRNGFAKNTSRFQPVEQPLPAVDPTLLVALSGTTATFTGTCSADQIAGVQAGSTAWAVRCTGADTPTSVAASLAALSGGSAAGNTVTLAGLVAARTGRDRKTLLPTRQQDVGFQVTVWSSTPLLRDTLVSAIDGLLSDVSFLALQDGSNGHLRWVGTMTVDRAQNSDLYRRDLYYSVDFTTTVVAVRTPVLFPGAIYAPGSLRLGALHS